MLIPEERLPPSWEPGIFSGVPGGVYQYLPGGSNQRTNLIDVTQAPYNADNTGATDAQPAIQSAIAAASAGDVVYLPAGTYRIDNAITLPASFSGKTLRGAGTAETIIDVHCSTAMIVGTSGGFYFPNPPSRVVSGIAKGSTTIVTDNTPEWTVGTLLVLQFKNDDSIPVVSTHGFDVETNQAPMRQMVRVVARDGDDIEFFPSLYADYDDELEVRVTSLSLTSATSIGVEDLTVDCTSYTGGPGGSFAGVFLQESYGCWLYNVKSIKAWNYAMGVGDCLQCEVRHCYAGELKGEGSNGAGLLFNGFGCLVEDNIFYDATPAIEVNAGSAGNVFSYNWCNGQCNTNHSPHNRFNLHEGNAWDYMLSDGYFGSESDATIFRNYIYNSAEFGTSSQRRFSRRFSVVGSICGGSELGVGGYPNIGNLDFSGTAQLSLGDPWRDWQMTGTLTARTDDNNGQLTLDSGQLNFDPVTVHSFNVFWGDNWEHRAGCTVTANAHPVVTFVSDATLPALSTAFKIGPGSFYPGPGGVGTYQEQDLDVEATVINKGNYFIATDNFTPLDGDPLPDSLIYDAEPDWWPIGMDWPPFDPEDPGTTANYIRVPAGLRFSETLPPEAPEITTSCTVTGTPIEGQVLTAVPGSTTGNPPPMRTWRWERDGTPIVGATSVTYLLVQADVGFEVGPIQIETNSEGSDESASSTLLIEDFTGDDLTITQVANASPVTELWLRGALTNGVSAPLEYYLVQHSGPYPTQPDNNFVYARFGTPQDNVYVFQGTISEAEAIASVP